MHLYQVALSLPSNYCIKESIDTVDGPSIKPFIKQSGDNGVATSPPFIVIMAKLRTISRVSL